MKSKNQCVHATCWHPGKFPYLTHFFNECREEQRKAEAENKSVVGRFNRWALTILEREAKQEFMGKGNPAH
jgi:hypothetical protein